MTIKSLQPLTSPKFIKTQLIEYSDNETHGYWEMVLKPNSVHILVYNTTISSFMLVSQPRIPVIVNTGIQQVIETCAGIVDKYSQFPLHKQTRFIAVDEVKEELGYTIHPDDLIEYPPIFSSVGTSGSTCYLYACTVTDSQFTGQKLEPTENITPYPLKYKDTLHFILNETATDPITKYLLSQWILLHPKE